MFLGIPNKNKNEKTLFTSITLATCSLLSACSTPVGTIKTNDMVESGPPLEKVRVQFDTTASAHLKIVKSAQYVKPTITSDDSQSATNAAKRMAGIFLLHFESDFRNQARDFGLDVVRRTDEAPLMKIAITEIDTRCDKNNCGSLMTVQGTLTPFSGRTQPWTFATNLGERLNREDLDAFIKRLLIAMRFDGILKK